MRLKHLSLLEPAYLIGAIMFNFLLLSSCADAQPQVNECVTGHQYGFWGGLWQGIISPISFIGSLFYDDIDMYAINNNGGWYAFGFLLGAGVLLGGGSKASSR
jgi:hypothetical protein